MTREAIFEKLNSLLQEVLDNDSISISEDSSARIVPGWDSVANIRLMLSIEDEFGFTFPAGEYSDYRNVGDLISGILKHTG
jgi:acyl carrier protein